MNDSKCREKGESQVESFKRVARELGCDEDKAAFEEKLRKIASAKPPKKRKRGSDSPS